MWRRILSLFRNLFRGERVDDLLDEELRAAVEILAQERMQTGIDPKEARRQALIELGGAEQVKEKVRDARSGRLFEGIWVDIRYGLRMLRRSPGFTAVAVLTLTLGIGANTAIFSIVNSILLHTLPFEDSNTLAHLWETKQGRRVSVSYQNFRDWQERANSFESVEGFAVTRLVLRLESGARRVAGAAFSPGMLGVLGQVPESGRGFSVEDDQHDGPLVALISQTLWKSQLGGVDNILGTTLDINGREATIVGVMPPTFRFPLPEVQAWIPLQHFLSPGDQTNRGAHGGLNAVGKLRPGISLDQARSEMVLIARQLEDEYPETNAKVSVGVSRLQELYIGEIRTTFLVLLAAASLIFLIACTNVASMILSKSILRRREIAIRFALGAGLGRVSRQLLVENLLLGGGGTLVGLSITYYILKPLQLLLPDLSRVPGAMAISVDFGTLMFAVAGGILSALLFTGLQIIHFRRSYFNDFHVAGKTSQLARPRNLAGDSLVIFQFAMTLALLCGSALMLTTIHALLTIPPGFSTESSIVTVRIDLEDTPEASSPERIQAFFSEAVDRVESLAGVISAAAARPIPFEGTGGRQTDIRILGSPKVTTAESIKTDVTLVTPGYFQILEIPLQLGRRFVPEDNSAAHSVVIIDQALADNYFPNQSPLGKKIQSAYSGREFEIVGIVGTVKSYGFRKEARIHVYFPHAQIRDPHLVIIARTVGITEQITKQIREQIATASPYAPVYDVKTMAQLSSKLIERERAVSIFLSGFAFLAVMLAIVGLWGLVDFYVRQRTHEFAVRMTLGASRGSIARMVFGKAMTLILIGVAIGLGGALALAKSLESLLFGITPTDPTAFVAPSVLVFLVGLLASYLPARRATKVDPMVALRYE